MTDRRAYLLLLVVIVFWAGNFPVSKLALFYLGPLTLAAARALVAAPLLLLVACLTGPLPRPLARRDHVAFAMLGLSGLAGTTTIWYWGLSSTTALNAGILGATSPIGVATAAALLLGDRLTARNWLGIALTVVAVLMTVTKGSLHALLTFSLNRGDLLILLSQVAWIVYTLYSRAATSLLPPVWVMAGAHVVSAAVLVPLALALEAPWRTSAAALPGWGLVLYGGVPVTLAHIWYYGVIRKIGPGRTATFMNLMPFVVIALAWAIAGEPIRWYHLVGAVLVTGGVFLTTRAPGR